MQLSFICMIIGVLGLGVTICRTFTIEQGPYKLVTHNTSNCITKEQPWFHTNFTVSSEKNGVRGTVVNKKEIKNVKFRIQIYYIDQGKIKVFEIKNQNCQNMIIKIVLKALGITYNDQKCTMKPLTTEIRNLNLDAVIHSVVQKISYGSVQIRWEIAVPEAKIMCLDIHLEIIDDKRIDNKETE